MWAHENGLLQLERFQKPGSKKPPYMLLRAQFFGGQLRFFRQLCTAAKVGGRQALQQLLLHPTSSMQ